MMKHRLSILALALVVAWGHLAAQDFCIDTISDALFQRMQGRSFPAHCTIARQELRHLRVLHRNADDSVCHGELVCNRRIAQDLIDIFRQLYQAHYPIERIQLIDDYEADDERSMAANNSSCFCYRTVEGSRHLSKHALGMAVDINTLYNPCVRLRPDGTRHIAPAGGRPFADRSKPSPYKIVAGDLLHRLFLQHGFRWGGSWRTVKDYQHFEK